MGQPIPPIVPDDGKSCARKNLPTPPDFPPPAAPEYQLGQEIATREAYGIALMKLAKVNPKVVAIDGDVKNSTFSETIEKADPHRLIECYIAEQNMIGVALGLEAQGYRAICRHLRMFPHASIRSGAHERSEPRHHQFLRLALRSKHRRRRPFANGPRRYRHVPLDSGFHRVLSF